MKTYQKGEIIFRQGDAGNCMYDIRWGSVGIYLDYGAKGEKKLAELSEDEFFGEMGMIDHAPRSATAVALENNTRLAEITEDDLGSLFRERPAKVLLIMQRFSAKLRKRTTQYMDACRTAAGIAAPEGNSDLSAEEVKARAAHYAKAQPCGYDV